MVYRKEIVIKDKYSEKTFQRTLELKQTLLLDSVKNQRKGIYGKKDTRNKHKEVGMSVPEVKRGWYNQFNRVREPSLRSTYSQSLIHKLYSQMFLFCRLYEGQKGEYAVKHHHIQNNLGQHPLIKLIIISASMGPPVSSGQVWHQMSLGTEVT